MCSINEDNIPSQMMDKVSNDGLCLHAVCRKCQVDKANTLLRKTDPYCRNCFMKYAIHKFRSTIGKGRVVKRNECILLAYSGGLSSGSMVQLVKQGLEDTETQKIKMTFKPALLHIDEGGVLNLTNEERCENASVIQQFAKECNFDLYTCSLEFSLAEDLQQIQLNHNNYQIQPSAYETRLKVLFSSAVSLTAKEDLLIRLRHRLIALSAVKLNHQKVFLGATATRLAGQLLTAMGQGRGAQIAEEIGFQDSRSGVELIRPMREFVDKEVAYLAHFLNVRSACIPTLASKLGATASVGRLTEEFVVKLQVNFPGTISTLFRIGDKLKSNTDRDTQLDNDSVCLICRSKIEEAASCSAYSARTISQIVSRTGPDGQAQLHQIKECDNFDQSSSTSCIGIPSSDCNSSLKTCCKDSSAIVEQKEWAAALCYGCRVTMQDIGKPELLPDSFQEEAKQRSRRQKLRKSVEQFLL